MAGGHQCWKGGYSLSPLEMKTDSEKLCDLSRPLGLPKQQSWDLCHTAVFTMSLLSPVADDAEER